MIWVIKPGPCSLGLFNALGFQLEIHPRPSAWYKHFPNLSAQHLLSECCTDVSFVFTPRWSWKPKAFLCIFCCRTPEDTPSPRCAATPLSPWSTGGRANTCPTGSTRMRSESTSSTVEQKTFVSTRASCWKEVRTESGSSY